MLRDGGLGSPGCFAAPLPLALLAGFLIGLLVGAGALPASVESAAVIVELLLVIDGPVDPEALPVEALEKPEREASAPLDREVSQLSPDWKFWLDFVVAARIRYIVIPASVQESQYQIVEHR